MDSMGLARQAVAQGITVLDEHGPTGWRDLVKLDHLAMSSGFDCVLGQIYRSAWDESKDGIDPYGHGRRALCAALGLSAAAAAFKFPETHGFADSFVADPDTMNMTYVSYPVLGEAWAEALSA